MVKFERDDGTGRPPRELQHKFLDWVEANLDGPEVLAGQLPTGVGKSMIARIIQRATKARIMVPSNILMDDTYIHAYPTVNFLKGKTHYECYSTPGLSCSDVTSVLKKESCADCSYNICKGRALRGEPTFFNPMSLYYLQRDKRYRPADVIIVDEAHQLKEMLMLITGKEFRKGKYNFPETTNEVEISLWMQQQIKTLSRLFEHYVEEGETEEMAEVLKEMESIEATLLGLQENPQNYCISIEVRKFRNNLEEKYLKVTPLEPPRYIVQSLLDCKKLILLSATLPKTDVESLLQGKPYKYLDMPSPIDVKRRTVRYRPSKFPMNFKADPKAIAQHIEKVIAEFPGRNTMIHMSYAWAHKVAPFFKIPIITHTQENKNQALVLFKREGGVFLASGLSEGIDLKGNLCRLNIVPMIIRMNPYDPAVKKRMAWKDGQRWYDMESIKKLIQECGRSTRGVDDESVIVVCDPSFPKLVLNNKADIPKSFFESISWSTK